jgi:hypothetical protein
MNEANEKREREIAERARQLFAASVAGLDGQTRSRLTQARTRAVEAAGRRRFDWWFAPARLVPLGAAAAAVLAVALFWQIPTSTLAPVESTVLNDFDILLEGEELDLFEELEFYAWLLEQPDLLDLDEVGDGSG